MEKVRPEATQSRTQTTTPSWGGSVEPPGPAPRPMHCPGRRPAPPTLGPPRLGGVRLQVRVVLVVMLIVCGADGSQAQGCWAAPSDPTPSGRQGPGWGPQTQDTQAAWESPRGRAGRPVSYASLLHSSQLCRGAGWAPGRVSPSLSVGCGDRLMSTGRSMAP